ncbi:MAG: tetratricopeptide repeat protein [Blastopirellula sp. JB062]
MMRNTRILLGLIVFATSFVMTGTASADTAEKLYAVAASQYARKDWEAAIVAFDRFLHDYPQHELAGPLFFYRGEALIQLEEYDSAQQSYEKFLQREQTHASRAQAEFRVAECYYLTGELEQAQSLFETFVASRKDHPLCVHALPYMGEIALASRDFDQAERLFRDAKAAAPSPAMQAEAELGLARSLRENGRLSEARRAYRAALSQELVELEDAKFELGVLEYRLGEHREAVKRLAEIADGDGRHRDLAKLWIAKSYYEVRDWPQAEERLQTLAQEDRLQSYQDEIDYLIARIRYEQGGVSEALSLFNRLLDAHQDSDWCDETLYYLAEGNVVTGDLDQASVAAQRLIADHPKQEATPQAVRLVARKWLEREQYDRAIELLDSPGFDDVAPEMETTATAWNFEKSYLRGIAQLGAGDTSKASQFLNKAIQATELPEQQGTAYYALGLAAERRQEDAAAASHFAKYLELAPTGEEATASRLLLASSLAKIGQLEDAQAAYALINAEQCDLRLYLLTTRRLAEIALKDGEKQWAGQLFQTLAAEGNPDEFVKAGLAGLSWVRLDAAHDETSAAAIEALIERDPHSSYIPTVLAARAQILLKRDNKSEALAVFQQIYRDYPDSDPAPDAMLSAAQILSERQEFGRAAELYRTLVQAPSEDLAIDDLHYQLGWAFYDQGNKAEAAEQWRILCENYPESPLWSDAAYRRAESLLTAKKHEEAKRLLEKIVAQQDQQVRAHATYLLGQIAIGQEDWPAVATHMAKLTDGESGEELARLASYWQAESLFRQQNFREAAPLFEQIETEIRGRDFAWKETIALRRAQLAAHLGDWDQALQLAESAAEKFPGFEQRHELAYLQGRCLARQARFADARAAYQRAIDHATGDGLETAAMAQWMIGETYFHQKNYQAAIQAYARVAALYDFPRWKAGSLLQIGKCYEISRQWEKAQKYYDEVSAAFPDTYFAGEAQQRLSVVRQRRETADVKQTERR